MGKGYSLDTSYRDICGRLCYNNLGRIRCDTY